LVGLKRLRMDNVTRSVVRRFSEGSFIFRATAIETPVRLRSQRRLYLGAHTRRSFHERRSSRGFSAEF
jgi:hypothetical protein